jgi:hypothetical protein
LGARVPEGMAHQAAEALRRFDMRATASAAKSKSAGASRMIRAGQSGVPSLLLKTGRLPLRAVLDRLIVS